MKLRIAAWSGAGVLIALYWALYALAVPMTSEPLLLWLARFTQPAVLVGSYFHFGLKVWWVLLANAATYGIVGWMVENLRRQPIPAA